MDMKEILEAAEAKAATEKKIEEESQQQQDTPAEQKSLSDEEFEAELVKRMGVGSQGLIKKTEQVHVLSEEEKKAAEEKLQTEINKL